MFPRKRFSTVLALLALVAAVNAHPEESSERVSGAELQKREHLANKRHLAARNCASSINAFHASRRAKRSLAEQIPLDFGEDEDGTGILQESTCVTTPELEEGPYYVNNELVRDDLVEDQEGVIILLDIGVIDTATCEPVPDALVEIWSANATGFYGAFEKKMNGGPPPRRGGDGPRDGPGGPRGDRPRGPPSRRPGGPHGGPGAGPRDDRDRPPPPPPRGPGHPGRPGRPGGPGGPGGPRRGGGPSMTTNHTWLRGGYPTDSSGTVEFTTLYPGFYPGRTVHIHSMVHTGDWQEADNGTLISHSGSIKHIGQMFFDDSWNDRILSTVPYTLNTGRRTRNDEDHDFRRASVDRSSAIVDVEMLGDSLEEGLIGFITIGLDLTADYSIHSGNYYNSSADQDSSSYPVVAADN